MEVAGRSFSFSMAEVKYNGALIVFAGAFLVSWLVAVSPFGRVLKAIRENEPRAQLLGYNTYLYRLGAMMISGAMAGAAGGAYALLFSYVGASFASILYSIYPLLWTLLGGAGTTLGPLVGTGIMFYLIDLASDWTSSYLIVVGVVLIALILWFPEGLLGTLRRRWMKWLP
jgi:branched-chain amino acid transport system permease protein